MRILVIDNEPTRRGPGPHLDDAVDDGDDANDGDDHDEGQGNSAQAQETRPRQASGAQGGVDRRGDDPHGDNPATAAANDDTHRDDATATGDDTHRDHAATGAADDHHSLRAATAATDHDAHRDHAHQPERHRLHPAGRWGRQRLGQPRRSERR